MQRLFYILTVVSVVVLGTTSCEKEEGFGGNSKIKGVIVEKVYDTDFANLQYVQEAKDEDVFIIFGDDKVNGENTSTSTTGHFEFDFLYKGDYKIYYYSEDTSETFRGNDVPMSFEVNLDKRETLDMDTLFRYKFIDFDDGQAHITGNIQSVNYTKNFGYVIDTTAAQNYDIFIVYNNHNKYDDRERTKYDGSFTFSNLALGHYTVFTYSDNPINEVEKSVIIKEIEITSLTEKVDLGNIYVKHED